MLDQADDNCPGCAASRLRAWGELTEEEREVVRRLPSASGDPLVERAARRRWCVRCWHEETGSTPRDA